MSISGVDERCEPVTLPCRPQRTASAASDSTWRDSGSSLSSQCMSTGSPRRAASSHSWRTESAPSAMVRSKRGMRAGRIAAVERGLPAGAPELDAAGNLVSPPFVDAHYHMDTGLSIGHPRHNESGTLLEGIRCGARPSRISPRKSSPSVHCAIATGRSGADCWRSAATSTSAIRACWRPTRCWRSGARSQPILTCSSSPSRRTAICTTLRLAACSRPQYRSLSGHR